MKKTQGFTLVELIIVVSIIAVLAATAIPGIVNARKAGNEASAIGSMRTLATVNEQYRTRFGAFPGALSDLGAAAYIDAVLSSGTKSGYSFTYASAGSAWSVSAVPVAAGTSGDRGFFADESGRIRFALTGAATSADAPIDE